MIRALILAVAFWLGLSATAAHAQSKNVSYLYCQTSAGGWAPCTAANPLNVTGGGGGGGGTVNQGTAGSVGQSWWTQLGLAGAAVSNGNPLPVAVISGGGTGGTSSTYGSAFPGVGTAIGLTNGTTMVPWSATSNYGTAPSAIPVPGVNAAVTVSALPTGAATQTTLASILTNLGSPLQAGGTVTANLGTLNGAATQTTLAAVLSALGSPFQAGGTVTANLGTLNGAATAALQGTNTNTTAHTCSVAGYSILGCLGQIDDDVRSGAGTIGSTLPATAIVNGVSSSGNLTAMIGCNAHVFVHITSATDTLLVQGVTSQAIKICGYKATFAGTATVYLENTASTNANCSSSNTQITGVSTGAAQFVDGFMSAQWTGLQNTSGNGLCAHSTGTGGVDVDLWYTQGS